LPIATRCRIAAMIFGSPAPQLAQGRPIQAGAAARGRSAFSWSCTDRRSAIDRQGPRCRVACDTNDRVIAAAIRLTDDALLAWEDRRCLRTDATSSPGLAAALHPIFDEMAISAVQ